MFENKSAKWWIKYLFEYWVLPLAAIAVVVFVGIYVWRYHQ